MRTSKAEELYRDSPENYIFLIFTIINASDEKLLIETYADLAVYNCRPIIRIFINACRDSCLLRNKLQLNITSQTLMPSDFSAQTQLSNHAMSIPNAPLSAKCELQLLQLLCNTSHMPIHCH